MLGLIYMLHRSSGHTVKHLGNLYWALCRHLNKDLLGAGLHEYVIIRETCLGTYRTLVLTRKQHVHVKMGFRYIF